MKVTHEEISKYFDLGNKSIKELYIDKQNIIHAPNDSTLRLKKGIVTKIPFKFGIVGNFECEKNTLTTLENSPDEVLVGFYCYYNQLSNLIGGPSIVKGVYSCFENPLTSLEGAPKTASRFAVSWSSNLPLLRLLQYKSISIDLSKPENNELAANVLDILRNHSAFSDKQFSKQTLLACQKDLIENGFIGNARW
jgi:hypothetical protein